MLCAISAKLQDWTKRMRAYSRDGHNCTRPASESTPNAAADCEIMGAKSRAAGQDPITELKTCTRRHPTWHLGLLDERSGQRDTRHRTANAYSNIANTRSVACSEVKCPTCDELSQCGQPTAVN